MDNLIVALVAVIVLTALASALVGCSALLLGAVSWLRRADRRGTDLREVTRDLAATQVALKKAQVNAKHGKTARKQHDLAEASLFAVIKLRDAHKHNAEIADNAAEHLAKLCRGDDE